VKPLNKTEPRINGLRLEVCEAGFFTPQGKAMVTPMRFTVEAGQHMAIVGPNGAGKSTLLRMLGGLLAPTTGHVLLNGEPLQSMSALMRARAMAFLGQTDNADVRLKVRDYVALGCLPHRLTQHPTCIEATTADALARCNLSALQNRSMGSLSGGERQRAHLARTLAQQPRVLLLDEPTNHLDPRATVDLLGMVRELSITVIAVLHNLSLVPPWADRVAVLQSGKLVRYDTPAHALNPVTVHQVFALHSYYLPHPHTAQPLLVLDSEPPVTMGGPQPSQRTRFFNHYEESVA
jgi:iron complex transport system ATP-binding protein